MSEAVVANILEWIPFEPDLPALYKRLRIKPGSENAAELDRLLAAASELAHPRALYQVAYVSGRGGDGRPSDGAAERGEDWVEIEGRRFTSQVLRVNLEPAHRVFPYLATCGSELQEWAEGITDMLLRFWAEAIKEAALYCAIRALEEDIELRYRPGKTATMSPGSLKDWPIQQQRVLFDLFGGEKDRIGVRLTDSLLMIPTKSVSGIRFPTEVNFESCQLCPRENCPGRRAPYDAGLYESRYHLKAA